MTADNKVSLEILHFYSTTTNLTTYFVLLYFFIAALQCDVKSFQHKTKNYLINKLEQNKISFQILFYLSRQIHFDALPEVLKYCPNLIPIRHPFYESIKNFKLFKCRPFFLFFRRRNAVTIISLKTI